MNSQISSENDFKYKKNTVLKPKFNTVFLAESQGFEPWRRSSRLHDFQSCAFDHSANSPSSPICSRRGRKILYLKMRVPSRVFLIFLQFSCAASTFQNCGRLHDAGGRFSHFWNCERTSIYCMISSTTPSKSEYAAVERQIVVARVIPVAAGVVLVVFRAVVVYLRDLADDLLLGQGGRPAWPAPGRNPHPHVRIRAPRPDGP